MKKLLGKTDRIIRFIAGVIILIVGLIYSSWWGLFGIIPLLTAIVGWCPLYSLFGISTNKGSKIKRK